MKSPVSTPTLLRAGCLTAALLLITGCEPPPITANGVVGIFGSLGKTQGEFMYPRAIAAEPDGSLFVVDKTGRIQRFDRKGKFETSWTMPDFKAGKPVGLSVHPDGRLFVADTHYHRVMVFDRDGLKLAEFGREGTGPGEFLLPTDVAFDAEGLIYVSEYQGNDRITKWSADFKYLAAFGEEPIEEKRLARPSALAVDDEQTLWVADACNHRLIRFSLDGQVLAVFGSMGDEPGQMRYPYDLSISPSGEIMVCEYEGYRLQWFSKDGTSTRVWGEQGRKPGQLFAPWAATYGPGDRVYIVDSLNARVQIVKP